MRRFAPLLLLLAAACHAQQDLANLDFETGALGEPPPGWAFPDDHEGYRIALVGEAAEGAQAVTVAADPTAERTRAFVPLTKVVDAAPYRGQRLRFRAAARAVIPEGQQGTAHLWLRIDGADGEVLAFDNMRDRPITDSAWATYEVSGDAGERAEQIAFGFFLQGDGQAWFDDAALEAVGELTPLEVDPPRALTARGRQNLIAFGRLLGYVRHFHPADAAAETDWDAFAVRGVRAIEDAPDADALAARLDRLFAPLAPTVQVYPTGEAAPPLPGALHRPEGEATVTRWVHTGFAESGARSVYGSERRRVPADSAAVPTPAVFRADLGGGVSAAVPLALWADAEGTLPHAEAPPSSESRFTGDDRATRLASTLPAWNAFQHFYPYFDVVDADWPAVLRAALDRAATDPDAAAFGRTLQRMMVPLADGHARIAGPGSPSVQSTPPLAWDWVEGRLVVTAADTAGLAPGDVVLTVDGVPAADTLASLEAHLSGTPQWKRYRALEWLRAGASDSALTLGIRDGGGAERSVALRRSRPLADAPAPERPTTGAEIAPGVRYVDLTTLTDAEWAEALPALVAADGVVLDLRGYPTGTAVAVLQHLTDTPIRSARWTVAEVTRPDRENLRWEETRWDLEPLAPHLDAEVAFLTDGRAISYAETVLGIVEAYGLGAIVGAPTAGANGNITRLALPSGHTLTWTGMRVLKHDGSQHHLVGIPPTLPAAPTVAAVRAGRDEVLERGIAAVTD